MRSKTQFRTDEDLRDGAGLDLVQIRDFLKRLPGIGYRDIFLFIEYFSRYRAAVCLLTRDTEVAKGNAKFHGHGVGHICWTGSAYERSPQ